MGAELHHVSVFVGDMERAVRLFRDVLGFHVQWRVPKVGGRLLSTLLGIDGVEAELSYLTDSQGSGVALELARLIRPVRREKAVPFGALGTTALSLSVRDLEGLHRALSNGEWSPPGPIMDVTPPKGQPSRVFSVRVESGLLLELIEESDP